MMFSSNLNYILFSSPPVTQPEPDPQRVNFYLPFAEVLATFPLDDALIFTDGSLTPSRSPVDTVFDHQTTTSRSGASVILCSATGKHPPIAFYLADGHDANLDSAPRTNGTGRPLCRARSTLPFALTDPYPHGFHVGVIFYDSFYDSNTTY